MKVLITGAGGNLGRCVIPALESQGHEIRLGDIRPIDSRHGVVELDVRDSEAVQRAAEGCDAIVHAAALHGIHLGNWRPEEFWAINVTGTFNVFEAAKRAKITKVVLCSTMGVYGHGIPNTGGWTWCDETLPLLPGDVYGMSKTLCETMGQAYGRNWGVSTVALRLGMFVPEGSLQRYGLRLLYGGVDDRDVAQAVTASLAYAPEGGFEAFNIFAPVRFDREDFPALNADFAGLLEQRYPGAIATLAAHGMDALEKVWGPVVWRTELAQSRLGYQPKHGFAEFVAAVEAGIEGYYPELGLPWWGV